jgi:hypothetical protein
MLNLFMFNSLDDQAEDGLPLDARNFPLYARADILLIRYSALQLAEKTPRCAMVSIAIASPPAHLKKKGPQSAVEKRP